MRSNLRSLRERIRQVEAGGHRETPLRRAYNHKLRAHRSLRGGGGLPNEEEFNALNDKVSTLEKKVAQKVSVTELYLSSVSDSYVCRTHSLMHCVPTPE